MRQIHLARALVSLAISVALGACAPTVPGSSVQGKAGEISPSWSTSAYQSQDRDDAWHFIAPLLARRLLEEGVTFVKVTSYGWDTHGDNFATYHDARDARNARDGMRRSRRWVTEPSMR